MSLHDCDEQIAAVRKTIRDVRDEHAEDLGKIMGEIGMVNENLTQIREFFAIGAYKRRQGLNGHAVIPDERPTQPSFPALESLTGSGRDSNPVKATLERIVGKFFIWLAGGVGIGIAAEEIIRAIWRH